MENNLFFLGIETSCDETGISIFNNDSGIISEYTFTQKIHDKYGGTIPELASRDHLYKIFNIIFFVLKTKKITIKEIHCIVYTKGPGLKSALFIGTSVAKSLSIFLRIPAIGINHLEAHILLNFAFSQKILFPCLCLLISGAHTLLLKMQDLRNFLLIGETLDDGIGETFDKVARLLKLYPINGVSIEKNIKYKFKYTKLGFASTLRKSNNYNFSFSGLKTEIIKFNNTYINKINLIYNFQNTLVNIITTKCKLFLLNDKTIKSIFLAGGVSANKEIRLALKNISEEFDLSISFLPKKYCIDNGSMVAFLGFLKIYENNFEDSLSIEVFPDLKLNQ